MPDRRYESVTLLLRYRGHLRSDNLEMLFCTRYDCRTICLGTAVTRTRGITMRNWCDAVLKILVFGVTVAMVGTGAHAQTITGTPSVALKNGESFELADAYWISSTCKSMLVSTPEVEVLDGPPGVTVTIKEAMVTPRFFNCATPIKGGKVIITANDIEESSYSTLTIRYKLKTKEGERRFSQVYKISLFPSQ